MPTDEKKKNQPTPRDHDDEIEPKSIPGLKIKIPLVGWRLQYGSQVAENEKEEYDEKIL